MKVTQELALFTESYPDCDITYNFDSLRYGQQVPRVLEFPKTATIYGKRCRVVSVCVSDTYGIVADLDDDKILTIRYPKGVRLELLYIPEWRVKKETY
jgi:hypothetical protein